METLKLEVTLGPLSLSYEGSEQFASESLNHIIEQLCEIPIPDVGAGSTGVASLTGPSASPPDTPQLVSKLSTTDLAAKMGVKTGTDLVTAATAYLHHTRGMEEFRRSDILSEMKKAKAFYKSSYGSNLSKSLDTLVKSGKLQNPFQDTYALPYAEIEATKHILR